MAHIPYLSHRSVRALGSIVLLLLAGLIPQRARALADTARFEALLAKGDSIYSQKTGYASFQQSLRYFDSAQVLAEESGEQILLAYAIFARGRVYDAWNKEPAKTIELFTRATELFRIAGAEDRYFYAKHLVAHAYDKVGDSVGATTVLRELVAELAGRDTATRRRMRFIPEMALIATEVQAYPLADSILRYLTRRDWIANDPRTYNYLDHYYLSQSRLDIYWRRKAGSPYTDSLVTAYGQLPALMDKLYYARQLADLYGATGHYAGAYRYRTIQEELGGQLASGSDFEQMQRALVVSETAAERRKLAYEETISRGRAYAIWGLSLLLAVITILSIYLYRRTRKYRVQSLHLGELNTELDRQVSKVELLNKEIQHRVKNNLYTIYSLLHMQQDSTDNEEVIAHLEAARLRVESVASLHDHILGSGDMVDFGAYIKVLVNKVVACFAERRKVITHIKTETVSLPLNTCFALSLILNEWITNSIKYAENGGEMLNMDIRIANEAGQVCIDYADDGIAQAGAPAKPGLGTEIIRLLTAQVKGRLTTINHHPYQYNLCIPNGRPD